MQKGYPPANDANFLSKLEKWLSDRPEVLVLFRYPYAAGKRDFEFFSSFQTLTERIRGLRPRTCIIAFRQPLLPIRGVVDDAFIGRCLAEIPEAAEYLVVETARRTYGKMSWFHHDEGVSHAELRGDLEECRGAPAAAGVFPDWLNDSDDVISAVVPDEDGVVRPAAY